MTISTSRGSAFADGRNHVYDRSVDLGIRFSYDELREETRHTRNQKEYCKAEQDYKERMFKEAFDDCERALEEGPRDTLRLLQKSLLLAHKDNRKGSLEILNNILQIEPDNTQALYWKAFTLAQLSIFEGKNESNMNEELECYRHLLRIDPSDTEVLYLAGHFVSEQQRHDEAIGYYEKALKLEPGYLSALRGEAEALFKLGRLLEALQFYEKHLKINPNSAYEAFMIGIILARLGKYLEAIEMMKKTILFGSLSSTQFVLPYLRYKTGDLQMSKRDILAIKNDYIDAGKILEPLEENGFRVEQAYRELVEQTLCGPTI